ncbi:phage major capsid protein [Acinetobacter baumannii]|uniref:Phage major capsid protein n=1 Tax=Acinetobacter baumannii TaxID=470 RepID=A0AAD2U0I3_ACIBA|nr:phage major capsid protein [Acinetobacter baumannii]EHZ6760451.1 phage major capsid protein [Acinetobacter baumannii]EHZ7473802.1 phage major capsid protein [Acinetobacter baumannii]EHZ7942103.1 phage major capsid protein [Acinetobacter baumannii]EKU2088816.1 phage major capsid protein [Acinetobacter baumannii]EKU3566927.1 phage major capsid protein [Acinetobacter baumannii]
MLKAQLEKVKATIAEKNKAMEALMNAAHEKKQTLNDEQNTQYTALEKDVERLELEEKRLEKLIQAAEKAANTATPVAGGNPVEAAKSAGGDPEPTGKIIVKSNLPKGIGFAQYAQAKIVSQLNAKEGRFESPLEVAKRMGFGDEVQDLITKATLGTTTDAGFAATLVHENQLVGEFVELLRQATVFDKLQGFRAVPFRSKIPSQVTGGTASWVGEGAAKPLTNPTFGEVEIGEHKLAAITVYTQELMRRSDPSVSVLVRDDLIAASAALVDATFLDSVAASAVRPAGVLNGVTATPNTGETAAAYEKDLLALINTFVTNNLSLDGAYFLMSETRAAQIALLRDALGNSYFNGMALRGSRTLLGIPVITSQSLGNKIILVKTSEILLAQDGGVDVSYSDQATLVDGSTTHHLWQENKFAVRVEKFITWAKRRPVAAAYLDYTTTPTP